MPMGAPSPMAATLRFQDCLLSLHGMQSMHWEFLSRVDHVRVLKFDFHPANRATGGRRL
jgi:hypothetical protein